MVRGSFVPALALMASVVSAACSIDVRGDERVVREEKRFRVGGDLVLTLRTFDGSIDVRGWDRDEVLVRIERRGSNDADLEAIEVKATQEGNRIVVEATDPRRHDVVFGWSSPSVSFVVSMPRKAVLRANTGNGAIVAEDLDGDVLFESGDGNIRTERVGGQIRARTGDGNVHITEAAGVLEINTGDGGVDVDGRFEVLHISTGDGRVVVEASQGSAMKEDWSIETGDGPITLRLPETFDAEVEARTGDGGVRADDSVFGTRRDGRRRERGGRDSMQGRLGNGGRRLRLDSGDGRIEIQTR